MAPLDITSSLRHDGQVATDGISFYRITGGLPNAVFTIQLTRTDGFPYPVVPDDDANGAGACGWNDTTPQRPSIARCARPRGGVLGFSVQGDNIGGGGYSIALVEEGIVNEGSPGGARQQK